MAAQMRTNGAPEEDNTVTVGGGLLPLEPAVRRRRSGAPRTTGESAGGKARDGGRPAARTWSEPPTTSQYANAMDRLAQRANAQGEGAA